MKSGNLNFLEPSGPLKACNGTSLPSSRKLRIQIEVSNEITFRLNTRGKHS
jgi:hypothetical protein